MDSMKPSWTLRTGKSDHELIVVFHGIIDEDCGRASAEAFLAALPEDGADLVFDVVDVQAYRAAARKSWQSAVWPRRALESRAARAGRAFSVLGAQQRAVANRLVGGTTRTQASNLDPNLFRIGTRARIHVGTAHCRAQPPTRRLKATVARTIVVRLAGAIHLVGGRNLAEIHPLRAGWTQGERDEQHPTRTDHRGSQWPGSARSVYPNRTL